MKDHILFALLGIVLVLFGLFGPCCASKPACEPKTVDAISKQYARLVLEVIDSGACDRHDLVTDCPAYRLLEEHQAATLKGLGCH